MRPTASRSLLALLLLATTPASASPRPARLRLVFDGEPIRVANGRLEIGPVAAHPSGAFAVAYGYGDNHDRLKVSGFDAEGEAEFVRTLGSLGYSGAANVGGLVPLGNGDYAVSWEHDNHYAGSQGASVAVVGQGRTRRLVYDAAPSTLEALAPDGRGGFFSLVSRGKRLVLKRWTASGALLRARRLAVQGAPRAVASYRGGLIYGIRNWDLPGPVQTLRRLDSAGRLLDQAVVDPEPELVTDHLHQMALLSRDDFEIVARFGPSPSEIGVPHTLAKAAEAGGLGIPSMAGDGEGRWLLAWSDCVAGSCVTRLRPFGSHGQPLGSPVELVPSGPSIVPQVVEVSPGRFLVAWQEASDGFFRSLWVRRLRLVADP